MCIYVIYTYICTYIYIYIYLYFIYIYNFLKCSLEIGNSDNIDPFSNLT